MDEMVLTKMQQAEMNLAQKRVDELGEIVPNNIKKERKAKGYTQEQFAQMLGISRDSLIDYEKSGELKFPTRVFISMCEILGCSPQKLMGIDEAYHRETQAIMDATGLSEDTVEFLIGINDYRKSLEHDGNEHGNNYAGNRAADYELIINFIGYFIRNMDFDIMIRRIKSLAKSEMFKGLAVSFDEKADKEKIEAALKNKTQEDKLFLMELVEEAKALTDSAVSNSDAADATAFRFSIMATEVLDNFSEEHLSIAMKLVEREGERR